MKRDLVALVYGDGSLYGAVDDNTEEHAHDFDRYWNVGGSLEELGEWELINLSAVPNDLAEQLMAQGTDEQHFSDGYEAWGAAKSYEDGVIDSGNTEGEQQISTRKFYKSVVHFEVLSEEPLDRVSLSDLAYETSEGHMSGRFLKTSPDNEELDGAAAARALISQGSDPEFFELANDGSNLEEE